MKRKANVEKILTFFNEEKVFFHDGYYRIRRLDKETVELAFLIAGPCGDTVAHPQITVSLTESQAIGTKLIDMHATPPLFLSRDSSTEQELDRALDKLIEKFLSNMQKNTKI
ncbi:hypothetical protein [Enterococcus termitis]|uniref:Uncharacterized protein n=1 Tax=Enterococcus termitis TaxID=332950 RepID=A0A1E5GZT6_9ENTE|nr:hypothetical protein [Enterococcus termitis]OEG18197.1 hypothetical protein BCR25_17050 [Enterococcus termitis]OJG97235.1 hypothetical protein RV18_GL001100 [Enterococcus termitis]